MPHNHSHNHVQYALKIFIKISKAMKIIKYKIKNIETPKIDDLIISYRLKFIKVVNEVAQASKKEKKIVWSLLGVVDLPLFIDIEYSNFSQNPQNYTYIYIKVYRPYVSGYLGTYISLVNNSIGLITLIG